MPEFWYSALTESGAVREGSMSAPNENALADQLRAAGAFLIKTEIRGRTSQAVRSAVLTDGTIDRKDLLAFLDPHLTALVLDHGCNVSVPSDFRRC